MAGLCEGGNEPPGSIKAICQWTAFAKRAYPHSWTFLLKKSQLDQCRGMLEGRGTSQSLREGYSVEETK
ncbi:hypothetical protein ANN_12734 [Periplaneta americana]|uniref:Uncharacterized protein n=1 Tax=Periplaneta americana TaxID=6978 RepID=A0ABQ8TIF3_PERAM|nr:hypothetical protein ANN_12734 [Periplaneta americana]